MGWGGCGRVERRLSWWWVDVRFPVIEVSRLGAWRDVGCAWWGRGGTE